VATSPSAPDDLRGQEAQMAWAEQVGESLHGVALPGGYINFLAPEETGRLAESYDDATATRLRKLKEALDPHSLFTGRTGL
jgi:hypothetical protein